MINLKFFENWFDEYTAGVRSRSTSDVLDMVDMKIIHTYKVRDHSINIAKDINLSNEDVLLAGLIGLFHDLGRFRQAVEYATMSDKITGSHADMSEDVFINEAPKDGLTEEEIKIIAKALKYHNLLEIPEGVGERELLHSQLVRDADKLDILEIFSNWEENQKFLYLAKVDGPCTQELLDMVLAGKNFKNDKVRNKNDCRLLFISMVYDLNFKPSLKWVLDNDILSKITGMADGNADENMKKVCTYVTQWIKDRL